MLLEVLFEPHHQEYDQRPMQRFLESSLDCVSSLSKTQSLNPYYGKFFKPLKCISEGEFFKSISHSQSSKFFKPDIPCKTRSSIFFQVPPIVNQSIKDGEMPIICINLPEISLSFLLSRIHVSHFFLPYSLFCTVYTYSLHFLHAFPLSASLFRALSIFFLHFTVSIFDS